MHTDGDVAAIQPPHRTRLLYRFREFEFDPASRELSRHGQRIGLRPRSLECLAYLIANRDRAVGRDELIAAVWGRVDASDSAVAQAMRRVREAIGDSGDRQSMIRTLPRFGYLWTAPIEEVRHVAPVSREVVRPRALNDSSRADFVVSRSARAATFDPRAKREWRFGAPLLAIAIAFCALEPLVDGASSDAAEGSRGRVLILPAAATPADVEHAWIPLGAMDFVAARLRRQGMEVVPREQALQLQGGVPGSRVRAPAELARLRWRSRARWIVLPEVMRIRSGWLVHLHVHDREKTQVISMHGPSPLGASASATDSWVGRLSAVRAAIATDRKQRLKPVGSRWGAGWPIDPGDPESTLRPRCPAVGTRGCTSR